MSDHTLPMAKGSHSLYKKPNRTGGFVYYLDQYEGTRRVRKA